MLPAALSPALCLLQDSCFVQGQAIALKSQSPESVSIGYSGMGPSFFGLWSPGTLQDKVLSWGITPEHRGLQCLLVWPSVLTSFTS